MTQSVGIDLGTTYSAVAQVQGGTPRILAQGDERIMPSVVGVTPQGGILVGTPARNQYVLYPERTARSIKRRMGQTTQVTLGEQAFTPPEVSALILKGIEAPRRGAAWAAGGARCHHGARLLFRCCSPGDTRGR